MDARTTYNRLPYGNEIPEPEFLGRISTLIQDLSELLSTELLKDGKVNSRNPVEKNFAEILEFHNNRNYYNRDSELKRLFTLMTDLKSIRDNSEQNFSQFKKQLRKCNRVSQYVGIRFEISLASFFIRKGVPYKNREAPDFEFNFDENQKAFVETTSCHIVQEKPQNLYLKVNSAIRTKSNKKYANDSTILVIDVTNLIHNSVRLHPEFKIENLVVNCQSEMDKSPYGAFIFRCTFPSEKDGLIYAGGDSYCKGNASPALLKIWSLLGYDERVAHDVEHGTYFCS
ncbi:hypothetical protein DC897_RS22345 [Vibrio parahaemolyticus]|uniref:hypothetical protein n=1 Tax=Vibrio parahaemolyticus TaxID=670 RepID=UPI000812DDA2|nr:hypothetical protein [Vibrio parahaemolyticus]EGQ8312353.1 hypothetical protein [Vibrio parahaemolyticus]EGQ8852964.1 hypothetical protein [Vibrio parahaemolyticus]EGQ8857614.1 hypothetical protein [Vibrio parahaemolyticus]EGQ8877071.1 hypothetical protein [Vibrio parahaemolyticus]EGQ8996269.1 hypothetical protein [Vibrio parahaemolyticus]